MVKHAPNDMNYQPLKYNSKPHSEFRTVFHVIVQVLQPKLKDDLQTWQQVADIWNHIFAKTLEEQSVRSQGGKHWRDQYVHRTAQSRPKEWIDVCKPDNEQSAAEIQRRAAYRQKVTNAAAALGIQVPASDPAWTPPVAEASKRKSAPTAAASPLSTGDSMEVAMPPPVKKIKVNNDGEDARPTFDMRYTNSIHSPATMRLSNNRLHFLPGLTSDASATAQQPSSKPRWTPPSSYQSGPKMQNDETLAHKLQVEEDRAQRIKRGTSGRDYFSDLISDEEDEVLAYDDLLRRVTRKNPPAATPVDSNAGTKRYLSNDDELVGLQPSKRGKEHGNETVFTRSGDWERRNPNKIAGSKVGGPAPRSNPKAAANDGNDKETRARSSSVREHGDTLSASMQDRDQAGPPPLPVVHGGLNQTMWIDGKPHAVTSSPIDGKQDPAILRASSLVTKRGGLVVPGVLDGKEQDVMVCVAGECGWCDPLKANSTIGATTRASIGKPIVHACCVKRDEVDGVNKFKPADSVGLTWDEGVPNVVNTAKVQFRDGLTRDVLVCVAGKCMVCKTVVRGTKKKV